MEISFKEFETYVEGLIAINDLRGLKRAIVELYKKSIKRLLTQINRYKMSPISFKSNLFDSAPLVTALYEAYDFAAVMYTAFPEFPLVRVTDNIDNLVARAIRKI
jgi:hypothetical protein